MADELTNRSILYYPTINIPTDNWLRQAILYWDEVGSIVPEEFEDTKSLNPDLQFLEKEGFYRPRRPYEAFEYDENRMSFEKELKDIISSKTFLKLLSPKNSRLFDCPVYIEKVLPPIFDELRSNDLARKARGKPYYLFEENTYYIYMALLARYTCWARSVMGITIPSTNLPIYENLAFRTGSLQHGTPALEIYFSNLLPIPGPNTALDDILSFRYRRRDELVKFRLILNQVQFRLQNCQTREDAIGILANFKDEITNGLTDIRNSMKSDNINIALGTMGSIITSHLGEVMKGTFDPITSSIPTLLGTVLIGYCAIRKINGKNIEARSPVSYLFHVQNEFGI